MNATLKSTRLTTRLLASVSLLGLLSGCVTTGEQELAVSPHVAHAYLADKPEELKPHFYVTLAQGNRNRVLNEMRLGLATLEMGNFALAEELFEDALLRIEAIYADNEKAKQARQIFVKELVKDFKGEPYERVMAYFYRGLLYMYNGEYDTARASFLNGMLQDQIAEEEQNQADFGLMAYMQAWASRCAANSSLAKMDFEDFRKINSIAPSPAESDNVMILVETGRAPQKYSATDPNSTKPRYLKFNKGSYTLNASSARVVFPEFTEIPAPKGSKSGPTTQQTERAVKTFLVEDIFRQASTRGGRPFDSILAGKAQFKDTANTVGDVALIGAGAAAGVAMQSGNSDAALAAVIMLAIAASAKAAAEAAEPNADTRYWDNLPELIHATTLTLPNSVNTVKVDFLRANDEVVTSKQVDIWRAGKCGLGWAREESARPNGPRAPFSAPPEQMNAAVVIPPVPTEPAPVVAGGPAKLETSAGVPTNDTGGQGNSLDKIKSGFMNLFSSKPAAAAESQPKSDPTPAPAESNSEPDQKPAQ